MSLQALRDVAKAAPGAFVQTSGKLLADALRESGADPAEAGSLYEHVLEKLRANPDCVLQVHRDVHLGAMLNGKVMPGVTPGTSTLET